MERKWRVLAVVCVAVFMLLLDITVVNVALPDIDKELNTSFTDLQWVVDAYALTLATTMLNAGSLGDKLGRKRVFLVAIALFTIASALCGAAQSPTWLILARGAQGIGGAGMFAVSLAIISQESTAASAAPRSGSGARPSGWRSRSGRSWAARSRPT
jgi:MFS family permease